MMIGNTTGDGLLFHFHHVLKNTICQMLRPDTRSSTLGIY